jgi:hypothetical protein
MLTTAEVEELYQDWGGVLVTYARLASPGTTYGHPRERDIVFGETDAQTCGRQRTVEFAAGGLTTQPENGDQVTAAHARRTVRMILLGTLPACPCVVLQRGCFN